MTKKMDGPVYNLVCGCKSLLACWKEDDLDIRVVNQLMKELERDLERLEKSYAKVGVKWEK